ncbi:MAG: beta-ketoacyl synthase, partial [Planctomycetaceae bacterium]
VTGLGAVSPLGLNIDKTWESVLAGRSGIRPITLFDPTHWPVRIAGEVRNFDFAPYTHSMFADVLPVLPRMVQLGIAATHMAVADSRLDMAVEAPHRVGISLGALSNMIDLEERDRWRRLMTGHDPPQYPEFNAEFEMRLPQVSIARTIADRWQCGGPCLTVSTACAAGTQAVGTALRSIQRGDADVMLAGGFDSMVHEVTLICFALLGALSTRNDDPEHASRPFDRDRDGFVISEGAAVLVLEELEHARRRGANIFAEVAGYGASLTTEHITDTSRDGGHPARAMTLALTNARLNPADIDYVNAHGTSTRANDLSETIAIRRAFGEHADRLAVSSTKSMTGHLVHAAGALEAVFSVLAIRDRVAPPTINYMQPDPACDLDYVPHAARELPIDAVLSNSFAFGGNNASLVFRRFESPSSQVPSR